MIKLRVALGDGAPGLEDPGAHGLHRVPGRNPERTLKPLIILEFELERRGGRRLVLGQVDRRRTGGAGPRRRGRPGRRSPTASPAPRTPPSDCRRGRRAGCSSRPPRRRARRRGAGSTGPAACSSRRPASAGTRAPPSAGCSRAVVSSTCRCIVACAPRVIASSLSSAALTARSAAFSCVSLAVSASSVASRVSISLRLNPPKICPKSKPHHHMPPTSASRATPTTARHGHGRCERTAILGASMEKC